jgi:hypothetical protein
MTRRRWFSRAAITLVALVACGPPPAFAYLKFGVRAGDRTLDIKWGQSPIRYFITERDIEGVTAADLRAAVGRAAATWQNASDANVRFEFQGFTTATPTELDGRTTIGFLDRPDLDRVLGATSFLLDSTTGQILEADLYLNTRFSWSIAPGGESGKVDVESVALHEMGHLMGLGHSAMGETERLSSGGRRVVSKGAVMFPIAMTAGSTADRVLQPDDVAGAADLYPAVGFTDRSGAITGRVRKNGQGVYGAHVVALDLERGIMVGGFTLNTAGTFVIAGLSPGVYIVRVEPLDDADVEAFFSGPTDIDFRAAYGPHLVVAPAGGTGDARDIPVVPK